MSFCKNCGAEISGAFCSSCGAKADYNGAPTQKEDLKASVESLCCLRAGLSVVSKEYDNVKKQISIVKAALDSHADEKIELKCNLESKEGIIKGFQCELDRQNSKNGDYNRNREHRISQLKTVVDDWEKNTKKSYTTRRTTFITFVLMFLIGLPIFITMFALSFSHDLNMGFAIPAVSGAISCGIGFWGTLIMLFFVDSKKYEKDKFDEADKELKELEKDPPKEIKSLEDVYKNDVGYQNCIKEIAEIKEKIAQLDVKYKIKEISDNAIKSITAYAKNGGMLYKALVDTYSSTLTPRDWEHIDLIISFLETGRADSLKEALQQLDLLKHTDRLHKATQDANATVRSIYHLETNKHNPNFLACASSINTALDKIVSSQDQLSWNSNEGMLSNDSLQVALQEKYNVPSDVLLDSVYLIKDYAEDSKKISKRIQDLHSKYGISLTNYKKSLTTK